MQSSRDIREIYLVSLPSWKQELLKRVCFHFLEPAPWAFTSLMAEAACRRKKEFLKRQSKKDTHHALPLWVATYYWAKSELNRFFSSLWMKSREKRNWSFLSLKAKCLHPLSLSHVPLSIGNETSQDTSSSPRERMHAFCSFDHTKEGNLHSFYWQHAPMFKK